jgi:small subunit ribosomal protein S4e
MHLTRQELTKRIPVPRKGTKYIARASSHVHDSVPIVIAVRDMLKLARTAKEVQRMIHEKMLKINGKEAQDYRESIRLCNLLEAGKTYVLSLDEHGKFVFEESKKKDERACKVVNKTLLPKKKIQLNLHDGSNVISHDKISVDDTVYLDSKGKIKSHVALEKGKHCLIISGKYSGLKGKVEKTEGNKVTVNLDDKDVPAELEKRSVMVI